MDRHVAVGVEIAGDGRDDRQHVFVKGTEKVSDHIGMVAGGRGVKAFDGASHMGGRRGFRHDGACAVENENLGAQKRGHRLKLRVGRGEVDIFPLIDIAVCIGQEVGFIVQGIGLLAHKIPVGEL